MSVAGLGPHQTVYRQAGKHGPLTAPDGLIQFCLNINEVARVPTEWRAGTLDAAEHGREDGMAAAVHRENREKETMGRQHHSLLKPLLAVMAGLFAQAAGANVIYDVKTTYSDDSYFSFSMEFADSTGTKSFADLISSGPAQDFQAENFKYSLYGLPTIYQFVDFTPTSLNFNPATGAISYAAGDVFKLSPSLYITGITDQSFLALWFRNPTSGDLCDPDQVNNMTTCRPAAYNPVYSTGTTVELRAVTPVTTPVPEPSTYALMGIGLAGLALSRRKAKARG